MALFRMVDGSFLDGETDILSKLELMTITGLSRSTIQRYMRQGLPYTLFDNNKAGFNLMEAQDWLSRNKALPPRTLQKRWKEHSEWVKFQKENEEQMKKE